MADIIYNSFKEYIADGTFDMNSDTFKICLLTSSYTPLATHAVYADLTNEVANGNGYTTGGATLANVTYAQTSGTAKFDADDASWTSATFTCRYAVIYKSGTANARVNPLVKVFDFTTDKSCSSGTFTVQFNASGILTLA